MEKNKKTKEEDLANLQEGKQERQRGDSGPGALDCVFSCAIAYGLHAPNEIIRMGTMNYDVILQIIISITYHTKPPDSHHIQPPVDQWVPQKPVSPIVLSTP